MESDGHKMFLSVCHHSHFFLSKFDLFVSFSDRSASFSRADLSGNEVFQLHHSSLNSVLSVMCAIDKEIFCLLPKD